VSGEPSALASLRARADMLGEIGRWRDAIPLLQSALRLEPDDARLHCRLARAHFQVGDMVQAMHSAERAIALEPSGEWGHNLRAVILLKGRDIRRILRAAEEAAALAPESAPALSVLTRVFLKAGKLGRARETAERLRRTAPGSPLAHEALTLVALRQRRWREAEAHSRAMLGINPLSYAAFYNLGIALLLSKRVPEAVESLLEARRLNPVDPLVRRGLDRAVRDHIFDSGIVRTLLSGAGAIGFFAFEPLDGANFGPSWVHAALFLLAALCLGAGTLVIRFKLNQLPPAARRRFLAAFRKN